ncbi:FdhF/YdeP family oxidoreductase [Allorhizobium terrae]|uniref:FdhF/YdeP family oxidoreductase n=1 Tax=Allorhizobium terrae TaxID=1848972 RepID=A0A4S3ZPA7_9HYPH|nr:FdhF/YdeP family oxidoreductase [Allorhizobium terrae]THF47330.1 FdhF/YdeP family oxidoreductase [Allorhizobium terrae]
MAEYEDQKHSSTEHDADTPEYGGATGGWGSLKGILSIYKNGDTSADALSILAKQNKAHGVMCTSCAWAKPAEPHVFEFCENGAKATLWEATTRKVTPDFFNQHTVSALRNWHDHDLESAGRLTDPMRYDAAQDRYIAVSWQEAFDDIGGRLKALDPKSAVFYASGHAGLEASFLYGLFARAYGHNNLPQSSNMCHETTSVNLKTFIGTPVGTCTLEDFDHCDAIFFFGQNTGSNSPRFLHNLKAAVDRGCRIVTFNPVREKGLLEFVDPQNPLQMTVAKATAISEHYFQVRPGGDIAVIAGMIKCLFAAEDKALGTVLDRQFIENQTTGYEEMAAAVRAMEWSDIELHSGLSREMIETAAEVYMSARNVIGIYGMGITQHVNGWLSLGMLVNLLLLGGNMGRLGAGISPVRGHSNVQGQRTVGICERIESETVPIEKLESLFGITVPRENGRNAVHAAEGILDGSVKAMIMLGGNLVRALPDRERIENAWPSLDLTVYVATKLNRSHLTPGKVSYILPCLGRTDKDIQEGGPQAVSMEDSLSHIYGSVGSAEPPSRHLRSEVAIICGLAKATLPENPQLRWDAWTAHYSEIRDLISNTYPDKFADFNERLFQPGGFYKGNSAREMDWKTESGKAQFTVPMTLSALGEDAGPSEMQREKMTLVTLRSNDQFNTTIYGFEDRLRGLQGSREVVLINREEMARLGLAEGQKVSLISAIHDGITRKVSDFVVTAFDLPDGCVAGYYPELNGLVPLSYHEKNSQTPAYKGAPVYVCAD